jgi:hypothetical protein
VELHTTTDSTNIAYLSPKDHFERSAFLGHERDPFICSRKRCDEVDDGLAISHAGRTV